MNDSWWTDADGTAHERCRLAWHHSGEWLCETDFDPGEHPGLGWRREGVAFYCRWCADVWARVILFNSKREMMPVEVVSVACIKHPDGWHIPGSILVGRLDSLLPLLPPEMLRREFEAHMQYTEKLFTAKGEALGQSASSSPVQATGTHGS